MKKLTAYFTKGELALWGISAALILFAFAAFFANDIYGFFSWRSMGIRQAENR